MEFLEPKYHENRGSRHVTLATFSDHDGLFYPSVLKNTGSSGYHADSFDTHKFSIQKKIGPILRRNFWGTGGGWGVGPALPNWLNICVWCLCSLWLEYLKLNLTSPGQFIPHRISAHSLEIEVGRYSRDPTTGSITSLENRLCHYCKNILSIYVVQDECHVFRS